MTTNEAKEYLGVSRQYLNVICNKGKLKFVKDSGTTKLFLKSDLDLYKQNNAR
ncbi:helix-turn-helix domain-containing protein [Desulfuribacillus stibiiarsenatis]